MSALSPEATFVSALSMSALCQYRVSGVAVSETSFPSFYQSTYGFTSGGLSLLLCA